MSIEEIKQMYDEFVADHDGKTPSVVEVEIQWKDTEETEECIMSLDDIYTDETDDDARETDIGILSEDDIFFHVESLENLCALFENSDGEDFEITDIAGFY